MIGIFDSGIGGLTVVKELRRQRPKVAFVYLGDTARMPYGNKNRETIVRYALQDARFLVSRGATSLVIACNSASAAAADRLREEYPGLPVFDVIAPAVHQARTQGFRRIGVIGTRATVASGAYERALRAEGIHEVLLQACPLLVPLIEEGWLQKAETKRIVKGYLRSLRQAQVDALILGCTHYPLLAPVIRRFMGNRVRLIDPGVAVVQSLLASVGPSLADGPQTYCLTDTSSRSSTIASAWLGTDIHCEQVGIHEDDKDWSAA